MTVPGLVPVDLFPPRLRVRLWRDVLSAIVAVPKASVDEGGDLHLPPYKVRPSRKRLVPKPSGQPRTSEQRSQPRLRRSVSGAAHAGHQLSARQPPKRRALVLSVAWPPAHLLAPSLLDPRLLIALRTCLPANLAYSGGTALPIKSHTASIWSVTN